MQVHLGDGFEIHGPFNSMRGDRGDPDAARGQEAARHRRADARVDRVRGGASPAGAGGRDRPDLVRARDGAHREVGAPAAATGRRPGDGRERSRAHRVGRGRDRLPVGTARRVPARDRVRAAGRARRELPAHAVGERCDRDPDERLLAEGDRDGDAPAHAGARGCDRLARLRRPGRVADLRLDGRGQGVARVDHAVPRARPRPARDPRQHPVRRPPADDRRQGDPGVPGARRRLGRPGAARVEPDRRDAGRATRSCSCSRTSRGGSPARWSMSTAGTTRWARRPPSRAAPPTMPPASAS